MSEQFNKALNIIKKNDDISEVIFKLFEQMRLMNDDLKNHLSIQDTKRDHIRELEPKLLKEEDYKKFLYYIKKEDEKLYQLSTKFAELTTSAKTILDDLKAKSGERQSSYGIQNGEDSRNHDQARILPR